MGAFSALADTCDLIRSCNAYKDIEHAIAKVDAPDKDQAALHTLGAIYVDICETRADRLRQASGKGYSALGIGPGHHDW